MKCLLLSVAVLAAAVLAGCFQETRQQQTKEVETRIGTEQGKPTNLVIERASKVEEETKAGMDPAAFRAMVQDVVQAAVPGAEAIAALIPKPKDPTPFKLFGMDPETVMGLAGAAWAGERGVAVAIKRRRTKTEAKT
jgi:hypothetical protein